MNLTQSQLGRYDSDGFLLLPDFLARDEVDVLRRDVERLKSVQADRQRRGQSTRETASVASVTDRRAVEHSQDCYRTRRTFYEAVVLHRTSHAVVVRQIPGNPANMTRESRRRRG